MEKVSRKKNLAQMKNLKEKNKIKLRKFSRRVQRQKIGDK